MSMKSIKLSLSFFILIIKIITVYQYKVTVENRTENITTVIRDTSFNLNKNNTFLSIYSNIRQELEEVSNYEQFSYKKIRNLEYINSLDDYINISTMMNVELSMIGVLNKGQKVYYIDKFDEYRVNTNQEVSIRLRNLNSELSSELYVPTSFYLNSNKLRPNSYYLNYTLSNEVKYSYYYSTILDEVFDRNDYALGCNYTTNPMAIGKSSYLNSRSLFNIKKFRTISFGLKKSETGLFVISFSNDTLLYNKLDAFILNDNILTPNKTKFNYTDNQNIEDFFITDQPYSPESYLSLINENQVIMVFKIYLDEKTGNLKEVKYFTEIMFNLTAGQSYITYLNSQKNPIIANNTNTTNTTNTFVNNTNTELKTTYIASDDNQIYVGTQQGLFIYLLTTSPNTFSLQRKIYNVENKKTYLLDKDIIPCHVLAIQILKYNTFIAINDFGLIQIEKLTTSLTNFQFLLKISNIDLIINPIMLTKYIGISLKSDGQSGEFFVELNVDDEAKPLINKVYLKNSNLSLYEFVSNDFYFSYVFDKESKQIILLRRGMLNNIPTVTYMVSIKGFNTSLDTFNIISIYNFNTKLNEIGFIDYESENMLILRELSFPEDLMECKFYNEGYYNVTLEKIAEACNDSLKYDYAYSYCDFMIYLNFNVIGEGFSDIQIIGIVIGIVLSVIVLMLVIVLFIRYYFKNQQISKPKPKREELYMDNDKKNDYAIPRGSKYLSNNSNQQPETLEKNTPASERIDAPTNPVIFE